VICKRRYVASADATGQEAGQGDGGVVLARVDPQAQIRVSPAVRAVETAQALSDQFQIVRELSPGADVAAVLAAVGWPDGLGGAGDTVIVVAHQPTLGRVASLLLSGTEADWAVRKGGIWWLSTGAGKVKPRLCCVR